MGESHLETSSFFEWTNVEEAIIFRPFKDFEKKRDIDRNGNRISVGAEVFDSLSKTSF